jgi:uncharacterized cupredoxin-like copper-binding protein
VTVVRDGAAPGTAAAGPTGAADTAARRRPAEADAPVRVGDDGRARVADLPGGWWRWPAIALAVALLTGAAAFAVAAGGGGEPEPAVLGPGDVTVELDIEHSLFGTERLRVAEGTRVRFVVVNGDPINHELIVGGPEVHARHEGGHEAEHPSVPGEVSVGAERTGVTTYTFDHAGTFEFACHLPGHDEYGMHGEVEVVPA